MYLLPEGREVARLREQREARMMQYNQKQNMLLSKQAEIKEIRNKITATQKSVYRTNQQSGNQELKKLKQLLKQKEQELNQLEQELYLSH